MATHDPKSTGTTKAASDPSKINPKDFTNSTDINNPYLPWVPGTTFVYAGAPGSGTKDTEVVTEKTKKLDGVNCVAVDDTVTVNGNITEHTLDYYAQDNKGNVWYFGEDSQEIQNGKVVSTEGSWRAGVKGAAPGIIMEADPKVGDSYDQENAPGVAQDHAEVISLKGQATVPYGHFNHLLVTDETTVLEPGADEHKYYAAGIGQVYGKDLVTGEEERLVSVTHHGIEQLVQAISSFGASDPGASTLSSSLAANDQSLQQVLAAQHA